MVARPGFLSLRRKAASIWLNKNRGNTSLMGCIYRRAMASSVSSAPKKVRIGASKASTPTHASTARSTEPRTAMVKY